MTYRSIVTFAAVMLLAVSMPTGRVAAEEPASFVVEEAYAAVTAGDIATAVEYLTEDAMFSVVPASSRMPGAALVGREAIGAWWTGTHKDNGRVEFADLVMDGERATFTCLYHGDKLAKLGVSPAEFDGVAILRDGKIRVLVWSYTADYEPKMREAIAKLQQ